MLLACSAVAAAIRLKQQAAAAGSELSVCVLEKGSEVGAHILSGAVIDPIALAELFPDWKERGAPLATPVQEDRFLVLTRDKARRIPNWLLPPLMDNHGMYIASLGNVCRWLGQRAEELGVEVFPGFAAAEVLFHENGSVKGVATGDMGIGRNGEQKDSYAQGMELHAKYTLFAEGCRGSLSQQLMSKFNLRDGVDPQVYCPPPDRAAAFASTGLPGRYAIGCFGRVREQKGTDLFVEAMCTLLPTHPDYTAVIVGAVDDRGFAKALEERVRAAGLADRVRFLGELPIEDLPRWYQRISIYAFTSRNEGFGLTLIEAMAAGAALVAARAGAAETVVADGETGVLVPTGDAAALTAALEPLMRDPERAGEMGRKARARVMAEFSIDVEAERIAAVYRSVPGIG